MEVSKVQLANGEVLVDLTNDSVTEETLAEGATAHDASGKKIIGTMKSGDDGVSVQSDWNQTDETAADFIKNKPFGEFKGDTLTWEFDIASLDFDSLPGGGWVKVSDAVVTMTDLANGCVFASDLLGFVMDIAAEDITSIADGILILPEAFCFFVDENGVGVDVDGIVFPEIGVYAVVELTTGSFTIPGYEKFIATKKMDAKYLPDSTVEQVVLYVSDAKLYKDTEFSYALLDTELIDLALSKKRVVISDIANCFDAITISTEHNCVIYANYNGTDTQFYLAYATVV